MALPAFLHAPLGAHSLLSFSADLSHWPPAPFVQTQGSPRLLSSQVPGRGA